MRRMVGGLVGCAALALTTAAGAAPSVQQTGAAVTATQAGSAPSATQAGSAPSATQAGSAPSATQAGSGPSATQAGSGPSATQAGAEVPTVQGQPVGGPQLGGRGVVVNYPSSRARRLPRVPASAYVIADAGTGQVLAAKDPHGWYGPASTLKVLTAVTLMPVLSPDQTVVASRRAADVTPSKVGLIAGRHYRVADLFKALLMISANDAAIALAQATGSYDRAMAMMNAEARHLQAYDTIAKTPNGLDRRGQHVSAYDEALFARRAIEIPWFRQIESLAVARFPRRPNHRPVKLWNQNTMLQTYPGDLGGKIGWTTPAKATFIGWARRHGHTLIVTILHCRPLAELDAATRLLNWGFAMDGRVRPVGTLVPPRSAVAAARPLPTRPAARAAIPAGSTMPGVPLAIGLATLLLAVLTGVTMTRLRRARQTPLRTGRQRPRPPGAGRPGPRNRPPGTGGTGKPPSTGKPAGTGKPGGTGKPASTGPRWRGANGKPATAQPPNRAGNRPVR